MNPTSPRGKWIVLGRGQWFCHACGDWLGGGDDAFETELGTYCSEGCADDAESHDDSEQVGQATLLKGGHE